MKEELLGAIEAKIAELLPEMHHEFPTMISAAMKDIQRFQKECIQQMQEQFEEVP